MAKTSETFIAQTIRQEKRALSALALTGVVALGLGVSTEPEAAGETTAQVQSDDEGYSESDTPVLSEDREATDGAGAETYRKSGPSERARQETSRTIEEDVNDSLSLDGRTLLFSSGIGSLVTTLGLGVRLGNDVRNLKRETYSRLQKSTHGTGTN